MKVCSIDNCPTKVYHLKLCMKHYARLKKHGSPYIYGKYNRGEGNTPIERFWSRVDIKSKDECWNWTASVSKEGYGRCTVNKADLGTHQASWFYSNGYISKLWILHTCDNRRCCNPNHLFEGTALDNSQDAISKQRHAHGETHGRSKLNVKAVIKIKSLINKGISNTEIAKIFCVTHHTISLIKLNKIWKHVK